MTIEVVGDLTRRVSIAPDDLHRMARRTEVADLHCVAGWSAVGLPWEGVSFAELYRR